MIGEPLREPVDDDKQTQAVKNRNKIHYEKTKEQRKKRYRDRSPETIENERNINKERVSKKIQQEHINNYQRNYRNNLSPIQILNRKIFKGSKHVTKTYILKSYLNPLIK
jgi:cobalamin-dependent methionine synthase I